MLIGIVCAVILFVLLLNLSGCQSNRLWKQLTGNGEWIVGEDIESVDITEFYYTRASSRQTADYQRYHFYAKDGKYYFRHEKREGTRWPLTEADVTLSGTKEVTAEWDELIGYLKGGTVRKRSEHITTGGSAPALYLYWTFDKDKYQEFSFESPAKQADFEAFCAALTD